MRAEDTDMCVGSLSGEVKERLLRRICAGLAVVATGIDGTDDDEEDDGAAVAVVDGAEAGANVKD